MTAPNTAYTVPEDPADPEAAALELVVRMPADLSGARVDGAARAVFQDFAGILSAFGAFTGMTWHDAKHAAVVIVADGIYRDDGPGFLRQRAARVLDGTDNMVWDDPQRMAAALTIGAQVLEW